MKRHDPGKTGQRRSLFLLYCTLAASACVANGGTYTWDLRSGLMPNEVDETMFLWSYGFEDPPVLTSEGLLLHADTTNETWRCYAQMTNNLTMPTQLVVEAEVRFVPSVARQGLTWATGGEAIGLITAPRVGNVLFIGDGRIQFWVNGIGGEGPGTNVPTADGFHRCRIEAHAPTQVDGEIRVYWDSALVLTGSLFSFPNGAGGTAVPLIYFGDPNRSWSGSSCWRYFRHNAAARTPGVLMSIRHAAELSWWAETNKTYQLQWKPKLSTNDWRDWGMPVLGDDSIKSIFDSTHGQPQKVYRVVTLP